MGYMYVYSILLHWSCLDVPKTQIKEIMQVKNQINSN